MGLTRESFHDPSAQIKRPGSDPGRWMTFCRVKKIKLFKPYFIISFNPVSYFNLQASWWQDPV